MTETIPMATREVRWFFDGPVHHHESLRQWFETTAPFARSRDVKPPEWQSRKGGQPDIYLLVPGSKDMGIKWRESQLQIKGRISSGVTQIFCGRHQGQVECWIKWSYANIPTSYQQLFVTGEKMGLVTLSVNKTRAVRKVRLDALTNIAQEVNVESIIDRSLSIELTDLEVGGKGYCSLAFEAFPDDASMGEAFSQALTTFLNGLVEYELAVDYSLSYPTWLDGIITSGLSA